MLAVKFTLTRQRTILFKFEMSFPPQNNTYFKMCWKCWLFRTKKWLVMYVWTLKL